MVRWAGTFDSTYSDSNIKLDMLQLLRQDSEKTDKLDIFRLTGAFCCDEKLTTLPGTAQPPCHEVISTGPSAVLQFGDDADEFLKDPEVVARAGLITERLGASGYDKMCENQS